MITPKKIFSYIQGWTRYPLYYEGELHPITREPLVKSVLTKLPKPIKNFILPLHIKQQIPIRIASSFDCVLKGQCSICKCSTPALQMADKACDKPCYPAMLSKKDWEEFYGNGEHTPIKWHLDMTTNLEWTIFDNKFVNKQDYISKKFLNNNHE